MAVERHMTSFNQSNCVIRAELRHSKFVNDINFRAFDHNGDGSISQGELREAMTRFGQTFTEEECEEMFRLSDTNADGKIDWEEFLQMMLPGHQGPKL